MSQFLITILLVICSAVSAASHYDFKATRDLVSLVNKAADLVKTKGEPSFTTFAVAGSKWRQKETYVFVLDEWGNMLVHPDRKLKGQNTIELKDINGRPIIKGLIEAATSFPVKTEGWYHYQWPEPNDILPRWKSSFVKLVKAPSGKSYIVGSGMYNDRMEKIFVIDSVQDAVGQIEKSGPEAFPLFRDQTGRFFAKDSYIFIVDQNGVELVNPAFPNLEGKKLIDMKDTNSKLFVRDMLKVAQTKGSGWVHYMWPKPGDSLPTEKSTYVMKAQCGDKWYLVGSGVYLSGAPQAAKSVSQMTTSQLRSLVRDAATLLEKQGEKAYPEFRKKGSKWFKGDTYFFVWNIDGVRSLHAADPTLEGKNGGSEKDILGRPYGKMFIEIAASAAGEGWVHYMYPFPGQVFPAWKSAYLKRVTLPSGKQQLIGSASYQMQTDESLIEDVVNRAAEMVKARGKAAFDQLRDKHGSFYFMDTYVFVDTPEGVELVNPANSYLEGKNISDLKDAKGKTVARDYINAAMKNDQAWVEYFWYKPGDNVPTLKRAFVRKVQSGKDSFIIGSGYYADEGRRMAQEAK